MKTNLPLLAASIAMSINARITSRQDLISTLTGGGKCPEVWTQVSQDLTKMFAQGDGQCNDNARAAVRASFHDCGTWNRAQGYTGGCDGSLFLSDEELGRRENRGLQEISGMLKDLATKRDVGVADMIAFAGSHATVSCPLGPTVPTLVGRKDSDQAAPDGSALLPSNPNLSADEIIKLFDDKGISPAEVSALVGAHSTAKQFFTDPARAGTPQDRTPGIWDVDFYGDTISKPADVFVFKSDMALAADPRSGPAFKAFVGQQGRWNAAFAGSFAKLIMLGADPTGMVDCTAALPKPVENFAGANKPAPGQGGKMGKSPKDGKGGKDAKNAKSPGGKGQGSKGDPANGDPYQQYSQPQQPAQPQQPKGKSPMMTGKGQGGKGNPANDPYTGQPTRGDPYAQYPQSQQSPQPQQPKGKSPAMSGKGQGGQNQGKNGQNNQGQPNGQAKGQQQGKQAPKKGERPNSGKVKKTR